MLCAAAVITALMAAAAAQSSPPRRLKSPQLDEIGRAAGGIPNTIIRAPARTLALAPDGYWGGQYTTSAGETVTIYASNSYAMDSALGQRWANFLASLVHGSELSTVTVLLSTPAEISRVCGSDALACYSPQGALLYAPELGSVRRSRDHARVRAPCGGQPRQHSLERARLGPEALGLV